MRNISDRSCTYAKSKHTLFVQ